MKPHELKNRDKTRAKKKGKTKGDKNQIETIFDSAGDRTKDCHDQYSKT
jgi:hypothetical protein